jgi:hypothetical protein
MFLACVLPLALGCAAGGGGVKTLPPADSSEGRDGPLDIGEVAVAVGVAMESTDGRRISIAQAKGARGTLVVFTCNNCPWAKAWEERIVALANAYLERGVGAIAINPNDPTVYEADSMEEMRARAELRGMKFPYVADATSGVAREYGATKTPEIFLFDAADRLFYYGAVDDNAEDPSRVEHRYLEAALDALVAGQPVAVATTKAIGCSIKFRP